jgi:hypothetical protein
MALLNKKTIVILAILCLLSSTAFSQFDTAQTKEVLHGDTITFSGFVQTIYHLEDKRIKDSIRSTIAMTERLPIAFNNEPLSTVTEMEVITQPGELSFRDYVLSGIQDILSGLPNGEYSLLLKHIIIDKKGKVVYFDSRGQLCITSKNNGPIIMPLRDAIDHRVDELMHKMQAHPIKKRGKAVYALLTEPFITLTIMVHDHSLSYP